MYNAVPKETALLRGQRYYKKTRLGTDYTDYTDYTDKFVKNIREIRAIRA